MEGPILAFLSFPGVLAENLASGSASAFLEMVAPVSGMRADRSLSQATLVAGCSVLMVLVSMVFLAVRPEVFMFVLSTHHPYGHGSKSRAPS